MIWNSDHSAVEEERSSFCPKMTTRKQLLRRKIASVCGLLKNPVHHRLALKTLLHIKKNRMVNLFIKLFHLKISPHYCITPHFSHQPLRLSHSWFLPCHVFTEKQSSSWIRKKKLLNLSNLSQWAHRRLNYITWFWVRCVCFWCVCVCWRDERDGRSRLIGADVAAGGDFICLLNTRDLI